MFRRLWGIAAPRTEHEVDVVMARTLQEQGAQLIDVREPDEFAAGHARGARNIPLGQLAGRLEEVERGRTVLLICRSGNRSKTAQELLKRHNIADTCNVAGGTQAWQTAGLPIETARRHNG